MTQGEYEKERGAQFDRHLQNFVMALTAMTEWHSPITRKLFALRHLIRD